MRSNKAAWAERNEKGLSKFDVAAEVAEHASDSIIERNREKFEKAQEKAGNRRLTKPEQDEAAAAAQAAAAESEVDPTVSDDTSDADAPSKRTRK